MARHDSARDTLRIGTNLLSTLSGSPLAFAAGWGLVHEDPLDGEQVVAVGQNKLRNGMGVTVAPEGGAAMVSEAP